MKWVTNIWGNLDSGMKVRVAKGKHKMSTICYGMKIWVNRNFGTKQVQGTIQKNLALLLITVIVRPVMECCGKAWCTHENLACTWQNPLKLSERERCSKLEDSRCICLMQYIFYQEHMNIGNKMLPIIKQKNSGSKVEARWVQTVKEISPSNGDLLW